MSNVAATAVKLAPVVLVFGSGVVFARRKVIGSDSSKAFSDFAFLFAIPCYLFGSLYASDLGQVFDPTAIAAYLVTALLGMVIVGVGARRVIGADARGTALRIMAGVQVNTTYFAIPVFVLLFGDAAPIFPTILLQVCVLTVIIIAIMEYGAAQDDSGGTPSAAMMRGVLAALGTPIVIACYLGVGANVANVPVPDWARDALAFSGNAAAPVALFALGLHLGASGLRLRATRRDEYALIIFKCVALPVMAFVISKYLFGIRGPWLTYLVLIAAMPAPQNLFIFAQRYDTDIDLAAAVVAKSSLVALMLVPVWLFVAR
ncbi:AEC family transporter [Nocardia australiensis]|uniref:AEC family transporter n=1 Tax=Nocardia australiensis TaxID=2887191 RepID=UPI001D1348DF|nr:AEC family transporter [Nocardia australiensis]